eukprot:GABV01000680.1.p1 GENE.GABV01000680.1~~GABV01000680.1.p1  ORF type:complete len:359 (-),score=67.54 GABV01000680.1:95-1171(-)
MWTPPTSSLTAPEQPDIEVKTEDVANPSNPRRAFHYSWKQILRSTSTNSHAKFLRIVAPLALSRATAPALTRNDKGHVVVFTGRGKDVGRSTTLFVPLLRREIQVNAQELAQTLARLQERLAASGDGELLDSDEVEDRKPVEGILVLLDTSSSMGGRAGFEGEAAREARVRGATGWDDFDPADDSTEAQSAALGRFRREPCLFAMRRTVDCRADSGYMRVPRRQAAEHVLEEYLRIKTIYDKSSRELDFVRLITRYRDQFVDILLKDPALGAEADYLKHGPTAFTDDDMDPRMGTGLESKAPAHFVCPLTCQLFDDPVTAPDGLTYERSAIETWISEYRSSPLTGQSLQNRVWTQPQH